MLVLERKDGQRIFIHTSDGLIEVSVHRPDHGRVKLGITAPDNVAICREEIAPFDGSSKSRRKT